MFAECGRGSIDKHCFPGSTFADVAPNFYPAAIGAWTLVMPCWAAVAAGCGAEPSVERSAAGRRCAAGGRAQPAEPRVRPVVIVVGAHCDPQAIKLEYPLSPRWMDIHRDKVCNDGIRL
jgi:hypothetical protein